MVSQEQLRKHYNKPDYMSRALSKAPGSLFFRNMRNKLIIRAAAAVLTGVLLIAGCGATDENDYYDYDLLGESRTKEEDIRSELFKLPEVVAGEDFSGEDETEETGEDGQLQGSSENAGTSGDAKVQEEAKPELKLCLGEGIGILDPAMAADEEARNYLLHIYEGLMRFKPSTKSVYGESSYYYAKTVYGQAKSVSVSEDALTYTFHLRDDIFWSDGEKVRADDFVYAWRRLVTPQYGFPGGDILNGIVKNASEIRQGIMGSSALGVRSEDDRTFTVELEEPCPYFLRLLTDPRLSPLRSDIAKSFTSEDETKYVTNGRYEVEDFNVETGLSLVPSESYYDDNEKYGRIEFCFEDIDSALSEYDNGGLDFLVDTYADGSEGRNEEEYHAFPAASTCFLVVNTARIKEWRLIAAMALAIDRDSLCEDVFSGSMSPLYSMTPHGITSTKKKDLAESFFPEGALFSWLSAEYPEYDLSDAGKRRELAAELMDKIVREGTFSRNTEPVFIYNKYAINKRAAKKIAKDWEEVLGLRVTLRELALGEYVTALSNHDFDIARLNYTEDRVDDMSGFFDFFMTENVHNYGFFYNYEFESSVSAAKKLSASDERDSYYMMAEEYMFCERSFGMIPLYQGKNGCLVRDDACAFCYSTLGYYIFM